MTDCLGFSMPDPDQSSFGLFSALSVVMMLSLWARSLATRESMAVYLAVRLVCKAGHALIQVSCCFLQVVQAVAQATSERAAKTPVLYWRRLSVADVMRSSKPLSPVKIPLISAALVAAACIPHFVVDRQQAGGSGRSSIPNCASDFSRDRCRPSRSIRCVSTTPSERIDASPVRRASGRATPSASVVTLVSALIALHQRVVGIDKTFDRTTSASLCVVLPQW